MKKTRPLRYAHKIIHGFVPQLAVIDKAVFILSKHHASIISHHPLFEKTRNANMIFVLKIATFSGIEIEYKLAEF